MERKIIRDEAMSLEGDGIIPKIYSLLNNKDPLLGKSKYYSLYFFWFRLVSHIIIVPLVFLPDTVIFKFDIPELWYFGNERGVHRKLKTNITLENIEKAFLKNMPSHGIVAQYIVSKAKSESKKPVLSFQYITKDEFSKKISL